VKKSFPGVVCREPGHFVRIRGWWKFHAKLCLLSSCCPVQYMCSQQASTTRLYVASMWYGPYGICIVEDPCERLLEDKYIHQGAHS